MSRGASNSARPEPVEACPEPGRRGRPVPRTTDSGNTASGRRTRNRAASTPGTSTGKPTGRGRVRPGYVAVGRVIAAWGVQGHFKVTPLTDFDERFEPGARLFLRGRSRKVSEMFWHRGNAVLRLEGIASPEKADTYRGEYLEVPETEATPLPEGDYYRWQLEGLDVYTTDGAHLGRVDHLLETGANDVLVVPTHEGKEHLIPLVEEYLTIDLPARRITVDPIPGLLAE